jgi:hypothetical protein
LNDPILGVLGRESNPGPLYSSQALYLLDHALINFLIILKGPDDNKTLMECRFAIGDYMDITITPPNSRMDRMDYGRRNFGGGDRYDRKSTFFCCVSDPGLDWTLIKGSRLLL